MVVTDFWKMKAVVLTVILLLTNAANAGFNGLTVHSRANCFNNESITWDATKRWNLLTHSYHMRCKNGSTPQGRWGNDGPVCNDEENQYEVHVITSDPNNHNPKNPDEKDKAEYRLTRRSAAVHWGEGDRHGNWLVSGHHWIKRPKMPLTFLETEADDCRAYDGWWEMQ